MTVGMREVKAKREHWRAEKAKKGEKFLGKHLIPVILVQNTGITSLITIILHVHYMTRVSRM